jgi:hypothetical protein
MQQVTTAYALANIVSEIRLGNLDAAVRQCDSEIVYLTASSGKLRLDEGADPHAGIGFLKGIKIYDDATHILTKEARDGLGDISEIAVQRSLERQCDAGVCRLQKAYDVNPGKGADRPTTRRQ